MDSSLSRRRLIAQAGQGIVAATLAADALGVAPALAQAAQAAPAGSQPPPGDPPKPIPLPPFNAPTERQAGPPPAPLPPEGRIGFAIVGLGNLTVAQILPAFGQSLRAKPVALVSGDPAKATELARQYGIPRTGIYSYQNFDQIRDNPAIQAVYIVLPNSLHAEYTVRAARAGKHVLCEKPMATSIRECQEMIDACKAANRQLMIAYRIQYEKYHRMMQETIRSKRYGAVKIIEAHNGQNQGDPNQWRQKKALAGGGALPDVGLYCLNTARFLLGEEPAEVTGMTYATPGDPRFAEVEETCLFQMRFPSGVHAVCSTGYSHHESRRWRALMERGWVGMDPAFAYEGLQPQMSYAEGQIERRQTPLLSFRNQFALELDHMAQCVTENRRPYTPGEEGLQDQRIMEAIYQSAREGGKAIKLAAVSGLDAFRGPRD